MWLWLVPRSCVTLCGVRLWGLESVRCEPVGCETVGCGTVRCETVRCETVGGGTGGECVRGATVRGAGDWVDGHEAGRDALVGTLGDESAGAVAHPRKDVVWCSTVDLTVAVESYQFGIHKLSTIHP